jgi:hypothetical protein
VQLGSFSFSWICPVNVEGGTISGKQEEEERMIDWKLHKSASRNEELSFHIVVY